MSTTTGGVAVEGYDYNKFFSSILPGIDSRLKDLDSFCSPEFQNKIQEMFSLPVSLFKEDDFEDVLKKLSVEKAKLAAFEKENKVCEYKNDKAVSYVEKRKQFDKVLGKVLISSLGYRRTIDDCFTESFNEASAEKEKIEQKTIRELMQISLLYVSYGNILKKYTDVQEDLIETKSQKKIIEHYRFTLKALARDRKIEKLLKEYQNAKSMQDVERIANKFAKLRQKLAPKQQDVYAYVNPIPLCTLTEASNFDEDWFEKRGRIEKTKDEIRNLEGDCADQLRTLLRLEISEPNLFFLKGTYKSFEEERKLKASASLSELVSRLADFEETETDFKKDNNVLKNKEAEYRMAVSCYKLFGLKPAALLEKQGEKLAEKRKEYSKIENIIEPVTAETGKINSMCDFDAKELEKIKLDENKFDSLKGGYFNQPVESYKIAVQRAKRLQEIPYSEPKSGKYFDLEKNLAQLEPSNELYVNLQDILLGKHSNGNIMERFELMQKELEIFPDAKTARDRNYLEVFRSVIKNWTANGAIKSIVENSKDNQYKVGIVVQMLDKIIERSGKPEE